MSAVGQSGRVETTGAALAAWLDGYGATFSRAYETTARGLVERHLIPALGDRPLAALERRDAVEFVAAMAARGLSASTTRGALSILRRVVSLEVEAGRLERNPFRNVGPLLRGLERRSGRAAAAVDAFTREELAALLGVARVLRPWLYPLLAFLAGTGARRGEALALRWSDVDLERGAVRIRRALVRGEETTPKSGRARVVPLDRAGDLVLEELGRLARRRPLAGERVFRAPGGGELEERNVSRAWAAVRRRAAERFGVRPLRLHDLRHTFASHALEAGISIHRVSAWLGHANPETTWRVYAHLVREADTPRGFLDVRPVELATPLPAPRAPLRVRPRRVADAEECA